MVLRGKMSKKLTTKQKNNIIKSLASGVSQRSVAKMHGVTASAICQKKSLINRSNIIKKKTEEALESEIVGNNVELVKAMREPALQAIKAITADAMHKQSASANATTAAILIDKIQLLTGGATENISIGTGEKSKLIDFVMQKESAKNKQSAPIILNKTGNPGNVDGKLRFK